MGVCVGPNTDRRRTRRDETKALIACTCGNIRTVQGRGNLRLQRIDSR
jgi:hypothetical protein